MLEHPVLLADVGGTNSRLGLWEGNAHPEEMTYFSNQDYDSLEQIVNTFLEQRQLQGLSAVIAIACPVGGDIIAMTNLGWRFSVSGFRQATGLSQVHFINDFEAVARSVPALEKQDVISLNSASPHPYRPKVVLGPGTGLGVAGLVPMGGQWQPVVTEGGHVTLPARNEEEAALIARLRQRFPHVSAERVVSGPGIELLYQAVCEQQGVKPEPLTAQDIAVLADQDSDHLCRQTMAQFFRFLACVAGNLALSYGALGGVYLAGGILPKNKRLFLESDYLNVFAEKGRFETYLQQIPNTLIVRKDPALIGLVEAAKALL